MNGRFCSSCHHRYTHDTERSQVGRMRYISCNELGASLTERLVNTRPGAMGCYLDVQHQVAPPSPRPHVTSTLPARCHDSRAPLVHAFARAPFVICIHGIRVHSRPPRVTCIRGPPRDMHSRPASACIHGIHSACIHCCFHSWENSRRSISRLPMSAAICM